MDSQSQQNNVEQDSACLQHSSESKTKTIPDWAYELIALFTATYGKQFTERMKTEREVAVVLNTWAFCLDGYAPELIRQALGDAVRESVYVPTPASVLQRVKAFEKRKREDEKMLAREKTRMLEPPRNDKLIAESLAEIRRKLGLPPR